MIDSPFFLNEELLLPRDPGKVAFGTKRKRNGIVVFPLLLLHNLVDHADARQALPVVTGLVPTPPTSPTQSCESERSSTSQKAAGYQKSNPMAPHVRDSQKLR